MTGAIVLLAVTFFWGVFVSAQLIAICWALRKQRARLGDLADMLARQAELNSLIAGNAKEGARFVADCRQRIERLEQITALTHAAGPN
jgi:hypothetical protein